MKGEMGPSIEKIDERKARYSAIADAFDCIRSFCTTSNAYCNRWIEAFDWLRIICTEYDLIVEEGMCR